MTRVEARLSHLATIAVSATGIAYFWMKYLIENDDPFSVVNHPWQPWMLSLHVVGAPVLVFVTGLIFKSHMRKKLASGDRSNRVSGLASMITLPVMIFSGYLLQVVSNPLLAQIAVLLHVASSGVFMLTYAVHQVVTFRFRRLNEPAQVRGRQLA